MRLPKISNDFLNIFFDDKYTINQTSLTRKNKNVMSEFYGLLDKYETNMKQIDNISVKDININSMNKKTIIAQHSYLNGSSIFLSEKLLRYIKINMKSKHIFVIKIGSILFTINIFLLNKNVSITAMKIRIIRLLFFISIFITNRKIVSLEINIILTDLKKELPSNPNEVLGSFNVNTGITWACKREGEILVYREEEWFKVLIHELFHSLCFDFSDLNINKSMKNEITKMFFIKHSYFSITETYCEFWANIINSILISYNITDNYKDFISYFQMFNTMEKYFSIFQCIKVLDHMNLNYDIITSDKNVFRKLSIQNYKEKTNVLGYYILKMVWLFHSNEMLDFFAKNNENNIINSGKNYDYLLLLIKKTAVLYKKNKLLDSIKEMTSLFKQITRGMSGSHDLLNSLRMTIIDVQLN
tara:strand:+ start:803 stop:2047 length:1245 start_codon:yes stop_codon:yes gene_type:complete